MKYEHALLLVLILTVSTALLFRPQETKLDTPPSLVVETTTGLPTAFNPVQVDVYSNFACPYSKKAAPVVRSLMHKYGGKINLSFHHYPLDSQESSFLAAEASECARDQGSFWQYHDALFNTTGDVGDWDVLDDLALEVGLGLEEFDECINKEAKKQFVRDSKRMARVRGVTRTPTFFIEELMIPAIVNIEAYEIAIEERLPNR